MAARKTVASVVSRQHYSAAAASQPSGTFPLNAKDIFEIGSQDASYDQMSANTVSPLEECI
jgi:hypothetical protein